MSSTPLAPSVNYKLLQTWEEEDEEEDGNGTLVKGVRREGGGGEETEEEEEDLNLNGIYRPKSSPRSTLQAYIHKMRQLDLEGRTNNRRNGSLGSKRGLMAALAVAVVLMVLLVSVIVYVNKSDGGGGSSSVVGGDGGEGQLVEEKNQLNQRLVAGTLADAKNITLTDILSGTYGSRGYNGTWISGNEIQYFDGSGNVRKLDVVTGESSVLIAATSFEEQLSSRPFEVTFSQDGKYALVGYDSQKVYRHSFYAKYAIWSNETKNFDLIVPPGENSHNLLQLVQWSSKNSIAYVFENNVYYRASPEPGSSSTPLTYDGGLTSQIFNGVTDWVYEEEMFSTSKAVWFSPDGSSLAFATFNDTNVRLIQYTLYGNPGQFPQFQYPVQESIAYPKAGTDNPTAKISIVTQLDQPNPKIEVVNLGDTAALTYYIGTALWASDTELMVVTLNRDQNNAETVLCNVNGSPCAKILSVNQPNGWLDINTPLASKDGSKFLMLKSEKQEDGRAYRHIVQFDRSSTKPVTSGSFSVDSITAWDEANNQVYFMSTGYNQTTSKATPSESHFYVVKTDAGPVPNITCLTCQVQSAESKSCRSNSVDLSKTFTHMVHSCNGPSVPEVLIRSVDGINEIKHIWENNSDLKGKIVGAALPIIQDYDIPVAKGFTAKARLWIPPNYEPGKKYPLLVDVYGGPGSQKISERWTIDWGTSLVSSRNVIYASIDGRGSGRQSDDLMYQIYRHLGGVEIEDQIAATKWLIENNVDNIIDAERTAIWGWSYGGYATAMVMGTDLQGVFKCGISVAPVTSWVFYDTIYTERYMGLPRPDDNLAAYNASDVTNHIQNFRTKKFYLIHGNADDNVHYQQSMVLSRALERADILFRQQSYPDENHGLGSVRRHLYHSLENFLFEECF